MKFLNRFLATLFLAFVSVNVYMSPTSFQQSVLQHESPELDELVEDAVVEEIARLVDVQKSDRKTIAKEILVRAKKPATPENITFVMNYLSFSLQQRLGDDRSTNTLSVTNCAKLIIEDLITVSGMAPTSEFKKKESESIFFSVSRIAILGCCAYIINMLFGVYSTLNSVFSVVSTATEAYSKIQATIDSLTGAVKFEGMQTRSVMQSEFEELGTQLHEDVEALGEKNHDEIIELTQQIMRQERKAATALGAQLEAQHKELRELQTQASTAQLAELASITEKLKATGTRAVRTLAEIQDSMLKMKSAEQKLQQFQFKKLQKIGVATQDALHEMQRDTTEVRVGMERVMGKVDVARSKISETTRCVTQGERRVTGHVERVERGVSSVGDKVDRVRDQVAQMSKDQKDAIVEAFRRLQEASTPREAAQAKKGFKDHVKAWGWEASLLVVQGAAGGFSGMLTKKGIELIFSQLGFGGSDGGINVNVAGCQHA